MLTPPAANRIMICLRRYLPVELVCTVTALLGAWAAALTGSPAAVAVAGAWGENVGFYGIMLGRKFAADLIFYVPTIISYELLSQRAQPIVEELPL
jgi:hypothetical protein